MGKPKSLRQQIEDVKHEIKRVTWSIDRCRNLEGRRARNLFWTRRIMEKHLSELISKDDERVLGSTKKIPEKSSMSP